MFSVVLALAIAFDQKVTVRVGGKSDSTAQSQRALSDTIETDTTRKHARKRIPVTPELERTAFRDTAARTLLLKAREARMRQDSALLAYDATAYQRMSAGLGFRAFGRDRLAIRVRGDVVVCEHRPRRRCRHQAARRLRIGRTDRNGPGDGPDALA